MKNVVLKPELRTPGGETVSIYCDDECLFAELRDILKNSAQVCELHGSTNR